MAELLTRLPELQPLDERAARGALRGQIARLEQELIELETTAPAPPGGPRLLSLGELETMRDRLAARAADARAEIAERTAEQEAYRVRIEEMLLDPDAHPWERVTNADIGEPGCKSFHVRPRGGILGMFASWWRVVISSGCPLPRGTVRAWPDTVSISRR